MQNNASNIIKNIRQTIELLQYEYNQRESDTPIQITEIIHQYAIGDIYHINIKIQQEERERGVKNRGLREYKYVYSDRLEQELRKDIEKWYQNNYKIKEIQRSITRINERMLEMTGDIVRIQYELGKGYREITDTSIVVGVNEADIKRIKNTGLFEGTGETEFEKMTIQNLRNWLKYAITPPKLLKIKEPIIEDLCIYTRKAVHTAIRGTVDMRVQNKVLREELFEDKEIIAIISREIRTAAEIELAQEQEKADGSAKIDLRRIEEVETGIFIEYKYKLKPIYKTTLEECERDVIEEYMQRGV